MEIENKSDVCQSKKQSYNLLYEPWIQCVLRDGKIQNVGLIDFNKKINEIRNINIPLVAGSDFPFYKLAFYRFIIVLYSVAINCSPWDDRDATVGISDDEINAVQNYLIKYKNKFDIMDEHQPFMQCTELDINAANIKQKPNETSFVTSFVHLPSENAINQNTLFGYNISVKINSDETKKKKIQASIIEQLAKQHMLSPKEAVYHLLYLNSFAKCAGAPGCSAISSTPELYVLFAGETIGQMIEMNLIAGAQDKTAPIWERNGIMSYYDTIEAVDCIGYTFYPSRFCRFEWNDDGNTNKLLYAPHDFKTLKSSSKEICKQRCKEYYQNIDLNALTKKAEKPDVSKGIYRNTLKYNRTENWLTMLMSAIINNDGIPEFSQSAKKVFDGSILLPKKMKIMLFGRSVVSEKLIYHYTEELEEVVSSDVFCDEEKRAYIEKYIRFIQSQFAISKQVVGMYYKLQNKINANLENKVPFINQCISLYAHTKLRDVYQLLEENQDVNQRFKEVMTKIRMYTREILLESLSEDVLCATRAYNAIMFGGKNEVY